MHSARARGARLLSVGAAVLGMTLGAAACGSTDSAGGSGADAKLPSEVVVGATLPLTGPGGAYGTLMKQGAEMAVEEINAGEGINGSKIKLVVLDDQAQAGLAVTQTRQLINKDKATAILTAFSTPPLAQAPIAARSKVPLFNGGGNDPSLLNKEWLWSNILMMTQEAGAMMTYAQSDLHANKLGILFETNNTDANRKKLDSQWTEIGGQAPTIVTVDQTANSTGPQLDKLISSGVDAIYLAADGDIAGLALKELAQRNVKIPVLAYSGVTALKELTASSTESLELYHTNMASDPTPEFAAKLKDKGVEPNVYMTNYYSLVYVVKAALEQAVEEKLGTNGEAIQTVLKKDPAPTFEGCCGTFSFTGDHGTDAKAQIIRRTGGESKLMTELPAP